MKRQAKKYSPSIKPLLIYYYGDGKGKTTAALGACLRAAGHGMKCLVLQAIKGSWPSGERKSIPRYLQNNIDIEALGAGFVGIIDDKKKLDEHQKAAKNAIDAARRAVASKKYNLIVLDEFSNLPSLGLIDIKVLLDTISNPSCHIVITGHKPLKAITGIADIVTEMKKVKHHFDSGIIATKGLDY